METDGPSKVDFVIGNPGHHAQMFAPVIDSLTRRQRRCRIISLCEFRGFVTPVPPQIPASVQVRRVFPLRIRRSPSIGTQRTANVPSVLRRWARTVSWQNVLRGRLLGILKDRPNVAVLPNDAAFPYNLIAVMLHRLGIPFVLVQEGVRFNRPAANGRENYGLGGAYAFAVWGESSAAYFRRCGVPSSILHITGNPRFDETKGEVVQSTGAISAREVHFRGANLLLLTNPIDDQGFCSTATKLALIQRFADGLRPLLPDGTFHLTVKPHARESGSAYRAVVEHALGKDRCTVINDASLSELFAGARAAVVLASSAGMDALMADVPLGVLEIPGHGFIHDYVSAGVAKGICWDAPVAEQVSALLRAPTLSRTAAASYLARTLCLDGSSAAHIANLIESGLPLQAM